MINKKIVLIGCHITNRLYAIKKFYLDNSGNVGAKKQYEIYLNLKLKASAKQ